MIPFHSLKERGEALKARLSFGDGHLLGASVILLAVVVMFLSFTLMSPALSPFVSISDFDEDGVPDYLDLFPSDPNEWQDSDGDGVGDRTDAFPDDPGETDDSDMDGVGDNADFLDDGDGGVRISLVKFEFEGYTTSCHRTKYSPDPWFEIRVDLDGDGKFETTLHSEVFYDADYLEDFFSVDIDLADDAKSIRFSIIAYDVWDVDNNNITDFEILDYLPLDGIMAEDQSVDLPCCCTWTYCGEGDSDAPDCRLEYAVSTIAIL